MNNLYIAIAVLGPSGIVALAKLGDKLDGKKTTYVGIGAILAGIGVSVGAANLAFLPAGVPEALLLGIGSAVVLANAVFSKRS